MSLPVVSVILPTRNRAPLLQRSVASVLAQTFTDFELIIVDDGSTDATPQVLASLRDPRVRVVRRDGNGSGAGAARNAGLAIAQGEFVAFQDDDDVWLAHKLAVQVAAMRAAPLEVGLCLGAHLRWHRHAYGGTYIGGPKYAACLDFAGGVIWGVDYSLVASPAWLVRKSVLDRAGRFDERMKCSEDLDLAMRVAEHCKLVCVDEPLHLQDNVLGSALMNSEQHMAVSMRLLVEKHGHRWQHDRKLMARHYYMLGRLETNYGDPARALEWLGKALSLRWRWPKLWAAWLLARFGQGPARRVTAFMRTRVRPSWIGPFLYRD